MLIFGLTGNERVDATWLFSYDKNIKKALDFIKEKDIEIYESIIDKVEDNYRKKEAVFAYIDNATIVAPVLRDVVKKYNCKYEIEGETNNMLTLKRMICYDKTIVVEGRYEVVDSTSFVLTPNVETLIFEEGVKYIQDNVLCQTEKLKKLVFPKSLKFVGEVAFSDCPNLSFIEFGNPKTRYGEYTFAGSVWAKENGFG